MNNQELYRIIDEYLEKNVYPLQMKESRHSFLNSMGSAAKNAEAVFELCDYALPCVEEEIKLDESFSEKLLRIIDEKGIKDSDCYKGANIDRKLFSKIRSDVHYRPSKETALALCISLSLPYDEIEDMLYKAGYALSDSSVFDVVVKMCIKNGIYDLSRIDETLLHYDQKTISKY